MSEQIHVAVLMGGWSNERPVSLMSGNGVADALERDYIPRPRNRVPVYLTRFDLYSDWTHQRAQYDINTLLSPFHGLMFILKRLPPG